jgi:hypothetical protein
VPEQLLVVSESNRGHSIHCPFPVIRLENDPDAFASVCAELMGALLRKEPIREPLVTMQFRIFEPEAEKEVSPSGFTVAWGKR